MLSIKKKIPMSLYRIATLIVSVLFAINIQAQSSSLSAYRWTSIDATGNATGRI